MLIEDYITRITGQRVCGRAAEMALEKTAHLIKARSVAYAATFCIFSSRLTETIGVATGVRSIIPGKGHIVHQLLALALPEALHENLHSIVRNEIEEIPYREYINRAERTLKESSIPPIQTANVSIIQRSKDEATNMLKHAIKFVSNISHKIKLDLLQAKTYTELHLMSYRYHIWGVADAIVEDKTNRKALIIEWKTTREADQLRTPSSWEEAQAIIYSILEGERLNYEDPSYPLLNGRIVPAIIRPRGKIPIYSRSPIYNTTQRESLSKEEIDRIILAAEHLTLLLTDVGALVGRNYRELCKYTSSYSGRRYEAFRKVPESLPKGNPKREPLSWKCNMCNLRQECLFYIQKYEEPEEIDRLAWRTRYAIYKIRENALQPLKELRDLMTQGADIKRITRDLRTLQSGNRVDFFDFIEPYREGFILKRRTRKTEEEEQRIITVREGRPVILFVSEWDVKDPLMRLSLHCRVDNVDIEDRNIVKVEVGAPTAVSKLSIKIFENYLRNYPGIAKGIVVVETNIDLTQLELKAVDAYQRGTKRISKIDKNQEKEAFSLVFGDISL